MKRREHIYYDVIAQAQGAPLGGIAAAGLAGWFKWGQS